MQTTKEYSHLMDSMVNQIILIEYIQVSTTRNDALSDVLMIAFKMVSNY